MNGSRSVPQSLGERSSLDALSRTIEGLEARIEGLVSQSGRDPRGRQPEQPIRQPEQPAREGWGMAPAERDPRQVRPDPIAEIRERQRMLEESRNRAMASAARPPVPQPPQPARDDGRREAERRQLEAERRQIEAQRAQALRVPQPAPAAAPSADAALKDIAQALVSLREDLKRDIHDGVAREFGALRAEMNDIKAFAGDQRGSSDALRAELSRLGESIDLLGHQARARGGSEVLKAEFEDLRSLMDGLAREESLRHIDNRWAGMEHRIAEIDPGPMRDEIVAIAYRLDDIKSQLGTLNPSPAIHALEDRLLAVAEAMEQIGLHMRPNDHLIAEQFAGLDLRLDEISRAIAASARSNQAQEPEAFNRLERRLAGLSDQIGSISEDNSRRADPADLLVQRIEALAARVEDLASADTGHEAAARLDERLDQLSRLMERNQKPAAAPELTGFLSDISRKIDALDTGSVNERLNERLEYLARRIDEIEYPQLAVAPQDDAAFARLETRLSDIARRLDETAAGPAQDSTALQNLEQQIANLASLINQPPSAPASFAGLPPEFESRMASIEDYMATSDEYIIEAARQAAEAVMEAYSRSGQQPAAVDFSALSALADDLRHLEELAHGTEERTHRTFEALHDTLVQIAGRLDDMDNRLSNGGSFAPAPAMPKVPEDQYYRDPPANAPFGTAARPAAQPVQQPAPNLAMADSRQDYSMAGETPFSDDELDQPLIYGNGSEHFDFSGPVIRTVEPEVEQAVGDAARAFTKTPDAEPAPKVTKGFLAGLTARFAGRGAPDKAGKASKTKGKDKAAGGMQERALVDPAPPMVPDDDVFQGMETELLEPGSGAPDIKKILERVRASQVRPGSVPSSEQDRSDLIAAARRAAQAAAQEARPSAAKRDGAGNPARAGVPVARQGSLFSRHRRPILMAVGAVLLAIMTLPLIDTFLHGADAPQIESAAEPEMQGQAPVQPAPVDNDADAKPVIAPKASVEPKAGVEQKASAASMAPVATPKPVAPSAPVKAEVAAPAAAPLAQAVPQQAAPLTKPATAADNIPALSADAPAPAMNAGALVPTDAQAAPIAVPAGLEPKALADAVSAGEPLALFEVGARYTEGRGVKSDLAEAARWYQLSADKGFAPAQYRIANLYEKGNGVAKDLAKARDYYERAAKAGNASAMHNLAVLYATGAEGSPDPATAITWFKQAAELGVSDSQFNLAILYARGNGIPQDLEESYKWFAVAAKGGDKDAAQKRDDVANAMRPEQLQNARAKVDLWKAKPLDPRANGTEVPDTWTGKGVKTASVDMKKAIRNIQAILNNNGFDAGKPDGEMGDKTVTAIKAFQKSAGLPVDGKITDKLVKELLARNK